MRTIVIGAGYWGLNYIKELAGNLTAVVETDPQRAEFVKQAYNVPVYPALPVHIDYDAAVIATPPDTHVQLAKPILAEGKYVLVEKPFATSIEESLQLHKWKNRCMAGMLYLYHPGVEALKTAVRTTPINHAYSRRTNAGPVRPWQNALWDLAAHDISIFNYVLGQEPHALECIGTRDWAVLRLLYVAAETVSYVSWMGGPKVRLVELVPQMNGERIIFNDVKTVLEVSPMRRMLDAFLSGDWDERCSFDAGLEVTGVLEKAARLLP